jgi:ABC-type multidrug transport system fused ATPase/permease subunit
MGNNPTKIIIGIVALLAIITFESFQQHYYIVTFELTKGRDISVLDLFWGHSYRWLIWSITALFLFRYAEKTAEQALDGLKLLIFPLLIIGLILVDTLLISLVSLYINGLAINSSLLLENITFMIYQKGPIFLTAYICLAMFTRYYVTTKNLTLQIQTLESLKQNHQSAYKKLKRSEPEDASIITVKVGKKVRFIPVHDISWISSDNYCVKIFTKDQRKHTLRSSMKNMERILPSEKFIRVHRTAIVNLEEISEVLFTKSPYLKLKDDTSVDIALSRVPQLRKHVQAVTA